MVRFCSSHYFSLDIQLIKYFLNVHSKNSNMLHDFLVNFSKKKLHLFSATYLTHKLDKIAALFLPRSHSGTCMCIMIPMLAGLVFIRSVKHWHSEC